MLNGYTLKGELQNANSGFSKWGFAYKNGREYFVKELISPVYPMDKSIMSDALFEQRRDSCLRFENRLRELFTRINRASHGNLVRVEEFFRLDSKYYIINEKINSSTVTMEQIAASSLQKKLLLLKSAAHCFHDLHSLGVVHFDVKPANLIIKITKNGNYAAKLIDFDSGFLKGENLEEDELGGDLTYLAPETFLAIYGEDVKPDEKSDIFALGLIFHEYFCGKLPYYDEKEYEYPYEAALDGGNLIIDKTRMPESVSKLIAGMLEVDPAKRFSAAQIISALNEMTRTDVGNLAIEYLEINYSCYVKGSLRKRRITLNGEGLCYNHIRTSSTLDFPDWFFEVKERKFDYSSDTTKNEFTDLLDKLYSAGIFNLVKSDSGAYDMSRADIDGIKCFCNNGMSYGFKVISGYDPEFIKIIELLAGYCNFPHYEKTDTSSTVFVETPKETVPEKKKEDGWFSMAGDL